MTYKFALPEEFFEAWFIDLKPAHLQRALGFDPGPDHTIEITALHVIDAACAFVQDGEFVTGQIRRLYVDGFQLYCIAGVPDEVRVELMYGFDSPPRCEGMMCFFILHAQRVV